VHCTYHLHEGAHRLGLATQIHTRLMIEGMVAGGCINVASRCCPAWLRFATWHPIRGIGMDDFTCFFLYNYIMYVCLNLEVMKVKEVRETLMKLLATDMGHYSRN
jgi:hypothetical protein